MRHGAGAGMVGKPIYIIFAFTLILFLLVAPSLGFSSDPEAASKAHNTEVLREIKEFRAEVQEMNMIVVKYMAESSKDISGLLDFKREAEKDIEELKKKSFFFG